MCVKPVKDRNIKDSRAVIKLVPLCGSRGHCKCPVLLESLKDFPV